MGKACRILMLVENLPVPVDPRVWAEATALRDAGCQVSVICPKGSTKYQEPYTCIDGIFIYRYQLPASSNKYTSYILEFGIALLMTFWLSLKVLLRHGFDVIHAANPPDLFFLIGLFYRLLGKKYVFDQHDLAPEMFLAKFHGRAARGSRKLVRNVLLFFELCSYQVAHYVIVTNLSQKWNATQRGRCSPGKVIVVRNGPDLKRLKPVRVEPALKRGRRYLLAYLGVMGQQDGVEYALYALDELVHKRGRQDVGLVLMGDGDHSATLKALAHELALDSYVNFTGWTNSKDIGRYLTVTDVGLSPDPENGLNEFSTMIKTMEYMAMSKPVVAFDLAETRFSAQGAALYARPNIVKDFASKIETLLDDEGLRLKLGAFGRKRIEEELRWEISKEHLLLMYKHLFPGSFGTGDGDAVSRIEEKVMVHH